MDIIYIKRYIDVFYIYECVILGIVEFVISICSMVCLRGKM